MAVEADNPHNSLLGVFNNRQVQLSTMDLYAPADLRSAGVGSNTACFLPLYQSLDSYQQLSNRTPTPAAACNPAPAPALVPTFQQQATPVTTLHTARPAHHSARKRKVPSDDMHAPSQPLLKPVHLAALNCVDLNRTQSSLSPPGHNIVSTGLRLASFDDDGSTVTSSRLETGSACVSDEVTAQLLNQQNDLRQLFKTHVEQLQQALKERTQSHSQALLVSVEDKMSRRLRDKDAELGRVKRHNSELEERIKHLSLETHMWQSKARSYEAMVTVLRANLQQAIMHQSREQGRLEGCGDSDADDAASAYIDENMDAQQNRALMMRASKAQFLRACKRCQAKEVTILILPCMHLCLCRDCKAADVERCPVCNTLKSAFIEVYLS